MKKFVLLFISTILAVGFVACSDDDDSKSEVTETLSGFYTIDGGNKSGKIPAEMTAYNFETGKSTMNAFEAVNGIGFGDNGQQAIVCDNKMFISMYGSDLIWVVEPETLKIISSIKPEGEATLPRGFAQKNGKLYCSMYTGYVSEIDPSSLRITRSVKVGPNPDQLAVWGNKLVVACSDGQNSKGTATDGVKYGNSCISIIDLSTFTSTEYKDLDKALNATDVASNGTEAFVVCKGDYNTKLNTVVKMIETKDGYDVEKVCEGTFINVTGNTLYVIYAQSGEPLENITYKKYNTTTLQTTGEIANQSSSAEAKISYPNGVFVDPASGKIVMLSYTLDANGSAQYRMPTYANIYDAAGNFEKRVECGVGARYVTFIHDTVK